MWSTNSFRHLHQLLIKECCNSSAGGGCVDEVSRDSSSSQSSAADVRQQRQEFLDKVEQQTKNSHDAEQPTTSCERYNQPGKIGYFNPIFSSLKQCQDELISTNKT